MDANNYASIKSISAKLGKSTGSIILDRLREKGINKPFYKKEFVKEFDALYGVACCAYVNTLIRQLTRAGYIRRINSIDGGEDIMVIKELPEKLTAEAAGAFRTREKQLMQELIKGANIAGDEIKITELFCIAVNFSYVGAIILEKLIAYRAGDTSKLKDALDFIIVAKKMNLSKVVTAALKNTFTAHFELYCKSLNIDKSLQACILNLFLSNWDEVLTDIQAFVKEMAEKRSTNEV